MPRSGRSFSCARCGAVAAVVMLVACATHKPLSSSELDKLDAPIRGLVSGDHSLSHRLTQHETGDGDVRYSVIMRTTDPEGVRSIGIPFGSVVGEIVTARLTVDEIVRAARSELVRSIETPERRDPQ